MSQQSFNVISAADMAYQLYQSKQYHECVDMCIQVLALDCTRADIWNLAGIVMLELKLYERAIEYFTQAAQSQREQPHYSINLAEAYRRNGEPQKCITLLCDLLNTHSQLQENSSLHFNLAKAYSDKEDSHNSIKHYTIAIKLDPNDLGAMFNLANVRVGLKHFGEAIELYLHALSKGYLDAGVNLASIYTQMGHFGEAIKIYQALHTHYKADSDFLFNYANALNYANADMQSTQILYKQAIALNGLRAEYYINYAHFLFKMLQFEEGFRIYEERKKLPNMIPQGITNIWQADVGLNALANQHVLVYYEQGFGDSIMFARFLPLLKEIVKSVCVIIQEPLIPLFTKLQIPCVGSIEQVGHYDVAISLLSLPLAFGVKSIQDLQIMPFMLKERSSHNKVKNIGICFSTDSQFSQAANKSIPLETLMNALQEYAPFIKLYSLNKPQSDTLATYHIAQRAMNDFGDTYEIIKDMDLVISIDTAVAHLSASMGKPTLVLLHKLYDWRWGNGIRTPWYEHVICFTQSKMHHWEDVMLNLKAYLKEWLSLYP